MKNKKKVKEKELLNKGITLIALVVTIIVLLILATISIATLTGENGLITSSKYAKFVAEVENIQTQIKVQDVVKNIETKFGTINGILGVESEYNEKLVIENGVLVYDANKVSAQEVQWLEEMKIHAKSNYYLIMMESTKQKFIGQTNIGTMAEFRDLVNAGNFGYDIAYVIEDIQLNGNKNNQWKPIGNTSNSFNAIFDGSDYTVDGIYIETAEAYQGLFGYNTGEIKNLKLKNLYISDSNTGDAFVGGIVGYNNNGTIENCYLNNSEIIATGNDVGGIVGCSNNGIIEDCHNLSTIKNTGKYATSGIVGWNYTESIVNNCTNSGDITGNVYVGGIVGTNESESEITNSYNTGMITSVSTIYASSTQLKSNLGGVCGGNLKGGYVGKSYNTGKITGNGIQIGGVCGHVNKNNSKKMAGVENCYNTGIIVSTGNDGQIGGICGVILGEAVVRKCYNLGNVTGQETIGGIVGHLGWTTIGYVENCYNIGNITITNTSTYAGGIAGITYYGDIKNSYNLGQIIGSPSTQGGITTYIINSISYAVSNCYYLGTTSLGGINSTDIAGGAESRTASEIKTRDFVDLLNKNEEIVWLYDSNHINNGYPILDWQ